MRISQLATQIQDGIITSRIEKSETKRNVSGKIALRGRLSLFFSNLFSFIGSTKVERNTSNFIHTESTFEFNTNDEQLNNVLKHFNNIEVISKEFNPNPKETQKLIRFRGACIPEIEGSSMSERLANYQIAEKIQWNCSLGDIKICFITSKKSLISDTPMSYALSKKNGTLFLDGIGSIINIKEIKKSILIDILPIVIGTKLD